MEMKELSTDEMMDMGRRLGPRIHPYLERALSSTSSDEVRAFSSGDIMIVSWLESALIVTVTGTSYDSREAEDFIKNLRWSTLMITPSVRISPPPHSIVERRLLLTADRDSFSFIGGDGDLRELHGTEDFRKLIRLYQRIETMAKSFPADEEDELVRYFSERRPPFRAVGVFMDDVLLSAAYISSGTEKSSMMAGVVTERSVRRHGYGSCAVSGLCRMAFENGTERLSLWPEKDTTEFYNRMGFREDGWYTMVRRN